ncbi:CLUMA_CG015407, isoform A [Clunio marinus]|uniref:CLUMA_CG015407, isoform A n=1 Tax=Clunio marinus TaxID=568069 RepID=A0A1J1INW4_9DIPT|nr:CLUMA_CG015407, isoform A [Clunio marinus]
MPLPPSISMMNGLHPVPSIQMNGLPPAKRRPPRPIIRPITPSGGRSKPTDEVAVSKLPPASRSSRYIQSGRLKIPIIRSNTSEDLNDRRSMSHESSYVSRSPSPAYSQSTHRSGSSLSNYDSWRSSDSSRSRNTPRRQFPQSYIDHNLDIHEFYKMEQSPVVYDANLSFVLGMKQPLRQSMRASPAHSEKSTASNYLSDQISNFLRRTDHVMEEWSAMGKKKDDIVSYIERQREQNSLDRNVGRSKSATNILVRGFQLTKSQPSFRRSVSRDINEIPSDLIDDDDRTVCDEELSEMTVELAEEHSTSNLASERLEAEQSERLRLEKELDDHQQKYRNLQESSEKLEMELICAKSDLNGVLEEEDGDDEGSSSAYRLKYERVARELEFTKKRLHTQHEHDLEQLVGLKKQLEKKLADAYEEVEEQRQVVAQWKRKSQKMTNEMNDLRMLLEEQNSRNNLLEKRQRKFDSECQALQDTARQERQAKDRLSREKDVLIAEKFQLEQNLADTRLELELKEEKVSALNRELEELTFDGSTEEEIAQLKRSKLDFEKRCKEQEEELDEQAGQIQLLEQAKLRLEMNLETMRKDARREAQQRDEEIEEIRGSSYKKVKALECQLEQEHEERTLLVREKHELERRLNMLEDQDRAERAAEEAATQKLKKDLRKCKALLRDAQTQLERSKADGTGKAIIRQLRNQLEDAESARTVAIKARQTAESELSDLQTSLDEIQRAKYEADEKATAAQRDRAELQAQIDENDEEMSELMKKYSATVKQLTAEQSTITEYEIKISELESEKNSLKEQISELTSRLENFESIGDSSSNLHNKRLELRTKELESRLEFEQMTRARLEVQQNRLKDSIEKAQNEIAQFRTKEAHAQEALKKTQKSLRELRDEFHVISNREQEGVTKRKDLEKRLETSEAEAVSARSDLRLALQRIADLQQAMDGEFSGATESDDSDVSSDESELDMRLRPTSSASQSTVINRTPKSSLNDSTNGLSLTNNHNTNNFNTTNSYLSKSNISKASDERDNTPRITISTQPKAQGEVLSADIENQTNGSDTFV